MTAMTIKEFIITVILSIVVLGLLIIFWPTTGDLDTSDIERDVINKWLKENAPEKPQGPQDTTQVSDKLLEEMEKASEEIAKRFPETRDAAVKAASEGNLGKTVPYSGPISSPSRKIEMHILLVLNDVPTIDREKGRSRILLKGINCPDLDMEDGSGPDYKLLASVLAALNHAEAIRSGKELVLEILPMAFVPFDCVREVVYAAARAGVKDIRLRQSPIPD